MNRALLLIPSLALLLPSLAEAQCPDGASFCAEIEVEGSVSFGGGTDAPPPPPPAEVEVQVDDAPPPPPAEVQVQAQPPRRRGRVVVVRPAPQAPNTNGPVVIDPAPQPQPRQTTVTVQTTRTNRVQVRRQQRWNRKIGLTVRASAMNTSRIHMGGLELGFRFRPARVFAFEVDFGTYGGTDYNDNARREHPLSFNFMFFLPKSTRFQAYMLIGGGMSFAKVDDGGDPWDDEWDDFDTRYTYIGGQLGLGVEWRISPVFALSADLRGFLRTRVDPDRDSNPEFEEITSSGERRSTNTSAGVTGNLGMHFYF